MDKKEFLSKIPETNSEWAAQQIVKEFSKKDLKDLESYFIKLDIILYKGWAGDMTFKELKEAVYTAIGLK